MITCSMPLAIASSTPYWMVGLSTSGSISLGCALVTGRNRVPRPAAGKMAFLTADRVINDNLYGGHSRGDPARYRGSHGACRRGQSSDPPRGWQGHLRDAGHDRSHGVDQPSLGRTP